jgi:hypothetical protein
MFLASLLLLFLFSIREALNNSQMLHVLIHTTACITTMFIFF